MMRTVANLFLSLSLLVPLWFYFQGQQYRPPDTQTTQLVFQGIYYQRMAQTEPRPVIRHVVTIDLLSAGIEPLVTPPQHNLPPTQTYSGELQYPLPAQTTREFLKSYGVQLGVNANYFSAFWEHTVWDFFPHRGDPVFVSGEAIGNGDRYGTPRNYRPALCFRASKTASIARHGTCPDDTTQAVSGRDMLLTKGKPLERLLKRSGDKPYPRTAVGIDQTGQTVWLVVVDGKQPFYSEGMFLDELAEVFEALGAEEAIALDGGGSVTLAINTGTRTRMLNAPIHTKWPMRERPVANHLGFYALPVNAELQHPRSADGRSLIPL